MGGRGPQAHGFRHLLETKQSWMSVNKGKEYVLFFYSLLSPEYNAVMCIKVYSQTSLIRGVPWDYGVPVTHENLSISQNRAVNLPHPLYFLQFLRGKHTRCLVPILYLENPKKRGLAVSLYYGMVHYMDILNMQLPPGRK